MADAGGPRDLKDAPWGEVIRTLGDELRTFIQQEMRLVSAELGDKVKHAGIGAGMFGAAGFMGFLAAGALTAAFILGLSLLVTPWLAALIVALVYGGIAGALAIAGKNKVQDATPFVPQQAVDTLQETKSRVQHAWQQGSQQAAPRTGSSAYIRRTYRNGR